MPTIDVVAMKKETNTTKHPRNFKKIAHYKNTRHF